MSVRIRGIEKTCLSEPALLAVISKYYKSEKKLEIVFDRRIKDSYGWFVYDSDRKLNLIRISPALHQYHDCDVRKPISVEAQKYKYISTILHELRHVQQLEELGRHYYSKEYCRNSDLPDSHQAYYYTESEVDARAYELQNILAAVEIYNSHL